MKKSAVIHARVEPQTKTKAEDVLSRLGMTPTEAIRLFYQQINLYQGIPFPIKIPNKFTKKALKEASSGKLQHFNSLSDMFKSWE